MGTLYLVATPIGNLADFSPRGVETLKQVTKIYAEDTRRTSTLLAHFQIQKPLESYFEQNELKRIPQILAELESSDVALVSDAGTPTISDPGFKLVRAAASAGLKVISIPGPSAALLALTSSGLPTDRFTFLGFLPKKEGAKKKLLEEVEAWRTTLVFYESPYRIKESLQTILQVLGDRPAALARELTKVHEETIRGSVSSLITKLDNQEIKGEVTLVIGGQSN